jgi:cardiolipin synthase
MRGTGDTPRASSSILTIPNAISLARILMLPGVVWLIVRPSTTTIGVVVLALVLATDWVDGVVARRTGQVSELGRILDPLADRLALAVGLAALVARGAFPVWAAVLIVGRDVAVLVVGAIVLIRRGVRIDVRFIGKIATFSLMVAVVWVSWGTLGLPLAEVTLAAGWIGFVVGIVESYFAAAVYLRDIRHTTAA